MKLICWLRGHRRTAWEHFELMDRSHCTRCGEKWLIGTLTVEKMRRIMERAEMWERARAGGLKLGSLEAGSWGQTGGRVSEP